MNKPSELDKPVAYMTAEGVAMTPLDFESGYWGMHNAAMSDDMWCPLYSQEYVSAMLARITELEVSLSVWEDCKHTGATWYDFSGHERCGKCGADV